jgi:hypothetical protein
MLPGPRMVCLQIFERKKFGQLGIFFFKITSLRYSINDAMNKKLHIAEKRTLSMWKGMLFIK